MVINCTLQKILLVTSISKITQKMLVPISLYPEIVIERSELRPLLILLDSFSDL